MVDPLLETVLALALAALFASAATHKVRQPLRFEAQLSEYRLVPEALVTPASRTLAIAEVSLAVALLLPGPRDGAAAAGGALLALYALAVGINLARGRDHIDCGCGDVPTLISPWLIVRNLVLVGAAGIVALPDTARALGWIDGLLALLALAVLALLWSIVELLLANASALREWSEARD